MENRLGKIESVSFGVGGYQGAMIGIHITLGDGGWGVCDSKVAWDAEQVKHTEHIKWTEEDRDKQYSKIMRYISKILSEAKVDCVYKLKGIPIEAIFEGNMLKEWRVLTEVL